MLVQFQLVAPSRCGVVEQGRVTAVPGLRTAAPQPWPGVVGCRRSKVDRSAVKWFLRSKTVTHVLGCLLRRHMSSAMGKTFLWWNFGNYCFKSFIYMSITMPEELVPLPILVFVCW